MRREEKQKLNSRKNAWKITIKCKKVNENDMNFNGIKLSENVTHA